MLKETKNVRDNITTGDMEYAATYCKEGIFFEIMGHLFLRSRMCLLITEC